MKRKDNKKHESGDSALMDLLRAIVSGERDRVSQLIAGSPSLAVQALAIGASRKSPAPYFFLKIAHYVYAGDTALHVAAAAYQREVAQELIAKGARPGARNRRGAEPLHYAADGVPGSAAPRAPPVRALGRTIAGPRPRDANVLRRALDVEPALPPSWRRPGCGQAGSAR